MDNILLIDKPVGITSFDVIRRLRREFKEKGILIPDLRAKGGVKTLKASRRVKMGHAGTLDPLASGLMIIGVGDGTKKLSEYIKLDKEYVAEILLGERRSTGDMEGEVLEEMEVDEVSREDVEEVLKSMLGTVTLPVSAYSAIKKDGVPMYKRARRLEKVGKQVEELPVRDMEVIEAEYQEHSCADGRCIVQVRFYVGSGTYIRSLAEEIGRRLKCPATLKSLRRTKVGEFSVEDARIV